MSKSLLRWLAAAPLLAAVFVAAPATASGGGGGGGGAVDIRSVSFNPSTIVGGGGSTGTATMTGSATQGAVIDFTSSNPSVVTVTDEAVVVPGASSTAFALKTSAVTTATTVTISAHDLAGSTVTGTVTVTPGTAPPTDTVHITLAQWKVGHLKIQATDSNPNAILTVDLGFTLTNLGSGKYQDERNWLDNPITITVTSNFGGTATASVTS